MGREKVLHIEVEGGFVFNAGFEVSIRHLNGDVQ